MNSYNLSQGLILTWDEEETIEIFNKKISVLPIWKWMLLD